MQLKFYALVWLDIQACAETPWSYVDGLVSFGLAGLFSDYSRNLAWARNAKVVKHDYPTPTSSLRVVVAPAKLTYCDFCHNRDAGVLIGRARLLLTRTILANRETCFTRQRGPWRRRKGGHVGEGL